MTYLKLSNEVTLILLCCCIKPDTIRKKRIATILSEKLDWDYIYMIANAHGILGLLYKNLESYKNKVYIPPHILKNLEKYYHTTAYRNLVFTYEFDKIIACFNNKDINIMPLKGIDFIRHLYNNLGFRSFSDIDFLVEKKNIPQAEQILFNMDYKRKKERARKDERHFHSIYWQHKRGMLIFLELHWDIDFQDSPFSIRIADCWDRAELIRNNDNFFYRQSLEDCIIFNAFHIFREDQFKILPLKNFCDLFELIKKYNNTIKWNEIAKISETYNVTRPVFVVLLLLQELFHINVPLELTRVLCSQGFQTRMLTKLVEEKIFFKYQKDFIIPSNIIELASEEKFAGKLKHMLYIFKTFCYDYIRAYYADLNHSIINAVTKTSRQHLKTLGRYFKTFGLSLLYPKKKSELFESTKNSKSSIVEISHWIRDTVKK